MNKNIPFFILIFFSSLSLFQERCSHLTRGAWGVSRAGSLALLPATRLSPRLPVPSRLGSGLGQDMCGQLEGEGEQAVPLAGVTKPNRIIYGTDFLQVVLQGCG